MTVTVVTDDPVIESDLQAAADELSDLVTDEALKRDPDLDAPEFNQDRRGEAVAAKWRIKHECTITAEDAFELYRQLRKPTIDNLYRLCQKKGHKVAESTLGRWAKVYNWRGRVIGRDPSAKTYEPIALMTELELESKKFTAGLMGGLQHRLVLHMAHMLPKLAISHPTDYDRLIGVIDKLDAIIHRQRGESISQPERASAAPAAIKLDDFRIHPKRQ